MTASSSQKLPYSRIALAGLIAIVASIIANVLIWWLGGRNSKYGIPGFKVGCDR